MLLYEYFGCHHEHQDLPIHRQDHFHMNKSQNHLNIIYPSNEIGKQNLEKIYNSIISDNTKKFLNTYSGNGQLSKTELEELLPINI